MIQLSDIWQKYQHISVCGYLYDDAGKCLTGQQLAQYFASIQGSEDFQRVLRQGNGCFGVILELPDAILAAVDKTRSYPLFYRFSQPLVRQTPIWRKKKLVCQTPGWRWLRSRQDKKPQSHFLSVRPLMKRTPFAVATWSLPPHPLNLSDKSETLSPLTISDIQNTDPSIFAEYLITGYVSGSDTLHPEIKQIPAGCFLHHSSETKITSYHSYQHRQSTQQNPDILCQKMHQVHLNVAQRLVDSLAGRTAVIPLSGGYDSRLIALLLKTLDYPKIIAFTYDAPGNPEAKISQNIAKALDIPWIFIPHTKAGWYQAFWSDKRKDFYAYAVNASSSAHVQDWLAVKTMQEQHLIPKDSVFIPGHSGDFLQGSHLPMEYATQDSFTKTELINQIIRAHYRLWPQPDARYQKAFAQRIEMVIDIPEMMDAFTGASLFEQWDLQERQAKFILNSMRVYEFFGYEWRLPLWDQEMLDFWSSIPLQYRLSRNLWHHYRKSYPHLSMPTFHYIPRLDIRILQKAVRTFLGNIWEVRYGRFAPYHYPLQYAHERSGKFLLKSIIYPDFVKPQQAILKTDMNALQALISIFELQEK